MPLSRFRQGAAIALDEGILFTTYATLRTQAKGDKASRVQQIIDWLGRDPGSGSGAGFDGVIVFDEAHAMANAAGDKGERGEKKPSQQGQAGLRLQHALDDARIVYVSATGATTVQNLAYAARLGLWGTGDFPFATRADFVAAMEGGGIAAMEVLARDLKALGLYAARSLSFEGIEYEIVEHRLSVEQVRTYDAYADAFQVIHKNLTAALEAANITGADGGTYNRNAKSAARSAFESNKQRFFKHLLTAMKCPTLIAMLERDLEAGHAAIVQVVSTNEALLDRRLAEIPTSEWGDLSIDITPREYVLDYLKHSFPTQLFELFTDEEGNLQSRPAYDSDGNPVISREAVERRDRMIEHLASLPPVRGALDQILFRFGTDTVAEVTGRSRRIVKRDDRLCVESRPASANFAETAAFMDDDKRVLVFSDAGGTGRSYHADLGCKNQRRRIHYLLEPGWKADAAIQGLGRSNRTNQKQPPVFRPVATDVKGEKRFLSTIARRLDTLGAITRGQRQTGGQGLFRVDDNLESAYAKAALRQFYQLLYAGKIEGCSLGEFQDTTGLDLLDQDGSLREDLPPITQFLNRILALRIALQNTLFAAFDELLETRIEAVIAAGTYDIGVETLTAESFRVAERRTVYTHAATGAETRSYRVLRKDRNRPLLLADAVELARSTGAQLLVNTQSNRAAVQVPAASLMHDDGRVEARTRLVRPMSRDTVTLDEFGRSHWRETSRERFAPMWEAEWAKVPEFSESAFHIITGLLLPIWDRLPSDNIRVYRFETDDGERVIGRLVTPEALARVYEGLGVDAAPALSPAEAWNAVIERGAVLDLASGLQVRRSLGDERVPHRADRLHRRHGRPVEGARPHLGDHRLAPAIVRAGRCRPRPGTARRASRTASAPPRQFPRRGLIRRCSVISAADLARRLARDAEAVCRHYLSNGRRCGHYWTAGDVMNTPGRSLYVRLTGPESGPGAAGNWTDAATDEHGDLLDLIARNRDHADLRDAIDEARRFLALPRQPQQHASPPMPSNSPEAARRLFRAGHPIPGTPAEAYLRARGIAGRIDWPALRYHPLVFYRETDHAPLEAWPALLAAVTDIDGNITGIQRTWLDPRRLTKAPLADPRRALGHLLGNGVRFGAAVATIAAGEGIETMLALKSVLPLLPMIAALSANHLAALDLASSLRRLYVARDNDGAGRKAAMRLHERGDAAGLDVRDLMPVHGDFNLDLCRLGPMAMLGHLIPQLAPADVARFALAEDLRRLA